MKETPTLNNAGPSKLAFLVNTNRITQSAAFLVSLRGVPKEPMTLSNGLNLSIGMTLCFRTDDDDGETNLNPDTPKPLDGFRYYGPRHKSGDPETIRYNYTTTHRNPSVFQPWAVCPPG